MRGLSLYKAEILRDVLTEQEIEILKNHIEDSRADEFLDEPQLGRSRLNLDIDLFPREILDKINELGRAVSDSEIEVGSIYTATYSSKFGKPDLPPHLDPSNAVLCIDYQLDSNTFWEIAVEGVLYKLKNNNALTIPTNTHAHWRKQKTFNDSEFVTMVFFHFNEKYNDVRFTTGEEADQASKKWMSTFINNTYIGEVIE